MNIKRENTADPTNTDKAFFTVINICMCKSCDKSKRVNESVSHWIKE